MSKEIEQYIKEKDKIILEEVLISHDGYDKYGPKSNLYDLVVIIEREGELLYEIFHKEDWYNGDVEEYYPLSSQVPFSRNLRKLLESKGYENYYDFKIEKHRIFGMGNKDLSNYEKVSIFPNIILYFKV